jgi:hypothetical protein
MPSPLQGTPKRWEAVAAYVRTRTMEEVLLIVKEKQGMSAARTKQSEDYKLGQKKRAEVKCQVCGEEEVVGIGRGVGSGVGRVDGAIKVSPMCQINSSTTHLRQCWS